MTPLESAVDAIRQIDEDSHASKRLMRRIHPLAKLCSTIGILVLSVSCGRYDLIAITAMAACLVVLTACSGLSLPGILYRLRLVLPFLALFGIANPLFDHSAIMLGGVVVSGGLVLMLTLIVKGCIAVLVAYLLMATTPMEEICYALRRIHIPKLIVTEILLIYRYLTLLLEEAATMTQAYLLRAPRQKGIHYRAWGSFLGLLLLRSVDRAAEIYAGMLLRGYRGEYLYLSGSLRWTLRDTRFVLLTVLPFFVLRIIL